MAGKKGAEDGNTVKVEYTGTLEDGTVFDSSDGKTPLEFEVGAGKVIPGFDNAVKGMKEGDEREFDIPPGEGYGERNEQLVREFPNQGLPPEAKEGATLLMSMQDGQQIPATLTKITDDTITLDLNHPLAGKKLHFKIKLVGIA